MSYKSASPADPTDASTSDSDRVPDRFRSHFDGASFADWHAIQEMHRNAEDGYDDTRNDPSYTPDADTHSPSQLMNCHRMAYYKANNAPREDDLPFGIFKFGHDFEAYAQEFIETLIGDIDDAEVRNPVQIEYETEDGLTITGSTDPVIFRDGVPVALTEMKTSKNLHFVDEESFHDEKHQHKSQAHAYARGLQKQFDLDEPPAIFFIYGSRESLETLTFEIEFDEDFWDNEALDWAREQTEHRERDDLPDALPDDSDMDYMCGYCDFAERCGNYEPSSPAPGEPSDMQSVYSIIRQVKRNELSVDEGGDMVKESVQNGNTDPYWYDNSIADEVQNTFDNEDVTGFLPLKEYPEDVVISHLLTYPEVKLTPTLAMQYPDLVDNDIEPDDRLETLYGEVPQRKVHDWHCSECDTTVAFGETVWNGKFYSRPKCPDCDADMRGPRPSEIDD